MICVILGHSIGFTDNPLNRMILCFHMSLFYFASGITFDASRYINYSSSLKAKLLNIVLPYLCFELMGIVLNLILYIIDVPDIKYVPIYKSLIGIVFPDGGIGKNTVMGFWFVYDIIIINLISLSVAFFRRKPGVVIPIVIYIILMFCLNYDICLRHVIGLSFFTLGIIFRRCFLKSRKSETLQDGRKLYLYISVLLLLLLFKTSFLNEPVLLYKIQIGNIGLFYFNAIIGIVSLVALSIFIFKNQLLEYVGRNTLPILFSHFYLLRFFYMMANLIFPSMKREHGEFVWSESPYWIITFIIVMMLSCLFSVVVNKYFPSFIGKGKLRSVCSCFLLEK